MKAVILALALAGCAPVPTPQFQPLHIVNHGSRGGWKAPMIAPLDHVNCRAVNNGTRRNSGCVA